jgi:hypothetical protein
MILKTPTQSVHIWLTRLSSLLLLKRLGELWSIGIELLSIVLGCQRWDLTFALHQVTFTVFILIFTKPFCSQDFQRPSRLLRSRWEVRIGQGRKKLWWMMKRTQMKKLDFFCDIEFVTVAMVFVSLHFWWPALMLLYMQYSFVFYIFKIFENKILYHIGATPYKTEL